MADQPVTREKLIKADIDVDNLGLATNEDIIVNPRYGAPYKSLPMIAREYEENGATRGFNTLAEFEAVKATIPAYTVVNIAEAGANQGQNIWDGATLTKSPYDPLTQANKNAEKNKAETFLAIKEVSQRTVVEARNFSNIYLTGSLPTLTITNGIPTARTLFLVVKPNTNYVIVKGSGDTFRIATFKDRIGFTPTLSRSLLKEDNSERDVFELTTSADENLLIVTSNISSTETTDSFVIEKDNSIVGKNLIQPVYKFGVALGVNTGDSTKASYLNIADGVMLYAGVKPSTQYTLSKGASNRFYVAEVLDNNGTPILSNIINNNAANEVSFTTSPSTFALSIYVSNAKEMPFIQLENGGVKTEWVQYGIPKDTEISKITHVSNDLLAEQLGVFKKKQIATYMRASMELTGTILVASSNVRTAIASVKPNTRYRLRKSTSSSRYRVALFNQFPIGFSLAAPPTAQVIKDASSDGIYSGDIDFTTTENQHWLAIHTSNGDTFEPVLELYEFSEDNAIFFEDSKNILDQNAIYPGVALTVSGESFTLFANANGVMAAVEVDAGSYTISKEASNRFQIGVVNIDPTTKAISYQFLVGDNAAKEETVSIGVNGKFLLSYLSNAGEKPFVQVEKGVNRTSWETAGIKLLRQSRPYLPQAVGNFFQLDPLTVDITQQLQQAFDASENNTVFINAGNYIFNRTLVIPSNATIIGMGEVTLELAPTATLTAINWRTTTVKALLMSNELAENIQLANIKVKGAQGTVFNELQWGVALQGEGFDLKNVDVIDVNYDHSNDPDPRTGGNAWGLVFYKAKRGKVWGGNFAGSGYENVGLEDAEDIEFHAINCGKGWRTSFQIHRGCNNIKVFGGSIHQDNDLTQTHSAVTLHGTIDKPVKNIKFIGVDIKNKTLGLASSGAGIQAVEGNEHYVTIDDCDIESEGAGITARTPTGAARSTGWIISNNRIKPKNFNAITINARYAKITDTTVLGRTDGGVTLLEDSAETCIVTGTMFIPESDLV